MQIITLINEKGGVGKTTLAMHIAAGLAIKGASVVLLDADPQANATYNMQTAELDGLLRLLTQDAEWNEVLKLINPGVWAGQDTTGSLAILPSHVNNRVVPLMVDDADILGERLDDLRQYFDFVIIDTNPTPSLLHAMMYRATDYVLIPTFFEAFSLQGLAKTVDRVNKEINNRDTMGLPPLRLLGIQPTQFDGRTNAHQYGYEQTGKYIGDYLLPPIAQRTAWRDAAYARRTIFAECPTTPAADEAWMMVEMIESAMKGIPANG